MIDIKEIENQITGNTSTQSKEMEEHSLSYMLLTEIKASARRWFIIALVELFIILGIIAGMIWYNSLPVETYMEVTQDTDGDSNQLIGIGDYDNGSTSDSSDIQETQNGIK